MAESNQDSRQTTNDLVEEVGETQVRVVSVENDSSRLDDSRPNDRPTVDSIDTTSNTDMDDMAFYDIPCSQEVCLDVKDVDNIRYWLRHGIVDISDLPFLTSISNLDPQSVMMLDEWKVKLQQPLARPHVAGEDEISLREWKNLGDGMIEHHDSLAETGALTSNGDRVGPSHVEGRDRPGPSHVDDHDRPGPSHRGVGNIDRPGPSFVTFDSSQDTQDSMSTCSADINDSSDRSASSDDSASWSSEDEFEIQSQTRKRKRKQTGKGGKKTKRVPVQVQMAHDWQRKKQGKKAKCKTLARNNKKRAKLLAQKKQARKMNSVQKILKRLLTKQQTPKQTPPPVDQERQELDRLIDINMRRTRENKRFMAKEKDFEITFQSLPPTSFSKMLDLVARLLDRVLERVLHDAQPHHNMVRLVLRSPDLEKAVQIPFVRVGNLNA